MSEDSTKIEPKIEPRLEAMPESRIEPTLTVVADAPAIAADTPEIGRTEPVLDSAPVVVAVEAPKIEPIIAPEPAMPRAATLASPEPLAAKATPICLKAKHASDAKHEKTAAEAPEVAAPQAAAPARRSGSRFPLLAASVALAASFGAVAGSFGSTLFHRPAPVQKVVAAPPAGNGNAEEIRALKETIAQLRTQTKALADNVSALKLTVGNTGAQITKIHEQLERRAAAPAAAPETTGSIAKPQQHLASAPAVLGAPPANLQHPVVPGWTLRRVFDGMALIEGREGQIEVEPGIVIPGLGRIDDIKKIDGRWAVMTSRGIIVAR